jgi:GT2 family glycosyltransferase
MNRGLLLCSGGFSPLSDGTPYGNTKPKVSVCVPNYNGMTVIDACLRSVLEQDCEFEVEILVHDDASSDASVAHIRECYPSVRQIESRDNVGFCVANNRMAAAAQGDFLLLLNNDAALFPDALRTLMDAAHRLEGPAILGLPQYNAATGELIDMGSLFDPFLNPVPNLDPKRGEVGMVVGACLWIPRSLWDELGGFPEWFHTLAEDMYLCNRARLGGYPVRALASSGFRHWVGKSLGGGKVLDRRLVTSRRRRILSERNKSFVMVLTYPAPLLHVLLPLHLLALVIEGVLLAGMKRDGSLFRDIYWACFNGLWQERRRLSDLRRAIQSTRRANLAAWLSVFVLWPHKLRLLARHGLPSIR